MPSSICKSKICAPATALFWALSFGSQALSQTMNETYTWEEIVRLVEKGDEIIVDLKPLKNSDNLFTVNWSQSLKKRAAEYFLTVAVNNPQGIGNVLGIFVQRDYVEKFLAQCSETSAQQCVMKVNESFRYIENYTKAFRFLVYQDPKSKPYMRRFMDKNTITLFQEKAQRFIAKLGRNDLNYSLALTNSEIKPGIFGNSNLGYYGGASFHGPYSPVSLESYELGIRTSLIEEKGAWCHEQAAKLSQGGAIQAYKELCRSWERGAWLKMASPHRASTRPEDLGKSDLDWIACVKKAQAVHQENTQEGKSARMNAETVCEEDRKLNLLAMGADPSLHYSYGPGAPVDDFFASGKWRLDR